MSNLNNARQKNSMVISAERYREGMASLAAAVNIVATEGKNGKVGFTATAVCSVSDSPATLMVCLNRSSSAYDGFKSADSLAINTLASGQDKLSNLFGGKSPMSERFSDDQWESLDTGSPILIGSAVSFDCVVTDVKSVATHDVIFCEVVAIQQNSQLGALLYYQRGYHCV